MFSKNKMAKCEFCQKQFPEKQLPKHQTVCPERTEYCEYCEQDIPYADYPAHEKAEEIKTRPCQKCGKLIMNRDYFSHFTNCKGPENQFAKVRPPKLHDYSEIPHECDSHIEQRAKQKGKPGTQLTEDYFSRDPDQKGPSIRQTDPGYGLAFGPKKKPEKKPNYGGDYFSQDRGKKPEYKAPEGARKFDPKSQLYDDDDFMTHQGGYVSEYIGPNKHGIAATTNVYGYNGMSKEELELASRQSMTMKGNAPTKFPDEGEAKEQGNMMKSKVKPPK